MPVAAPLLLILAAGEGFWVDQFTTASDSYQLKNRVTPAFVTYGYFES